MHLLRADDFYFPEKVGSIKERLRQGEAITDATIDWGERVGVVAPNPSSRKHFRATACGPFAALGWPGAPPFYLQLISDAVCAVFAIDDLADGDVESALLPDKPSCEHLFSTIASFWYEGDESVLSSANPLHVASRELRRRMRRYGASTAWLRRFARSLKDWLVGIREEEEYKRQQEIPDPYEIMELRPDSGAAFVFMHFIESSRGFELPDDVYNSADLNTLKQLAARMVIYPNEIWSYAKETAHGHSINLVTSLMHHKKMSLKEAIVSAAEMHNTDMIMFDDVARRILGSPRSGPDVHAFVIGLQYFLHGLFVWGWHAQRYSRDFFDTDRVPHSGRAAISQQRLRTVPLSLLDFKAQAKR